MSNFDSFFFRGAELINSNLIRQVLGVAPVSSIIRLWSLMLNYDIFLQGCGAGQL